MNFIITNFIFPRLHYLFYATLALMFGISCQFLGVWLSAQMGVATFLIALGLIKYWLRAFWQPIFFIAAISVTAGTFLCFTQQQTQLQFQKLVAGSRVCLRGTISSIEKIQNPRFNVRILLETDQLKKDDLWASCGQTI